MSTVNPPHDFAMARQVTVIRSGGIQGGKSTFVFALDRTPPRGFTTADVTDILKAAADPMLKQVGATPPGDTCCDRYVYHLTVEYPDGSTDSYSAVEGEHQPAPLAHLLDLVA
jgi:hypothetical protein